MYTFKLRKRMPINFIEQYNDSSSQYVRTESCKELGFGAETKIVLFAHVIVYLEKPK